ncbi:TetR/AcrR family transcriptional regulator [Methylophilus luteus]|uniref:TetR/AcrR family transcriptional regulator n=1 Tax=Methylophilus luteus TaxID=640108 RepID=A0ABW3F7M4_9PROT
MSEIEEAKRPYHHGNLKKVIVDTALHMLTENNGWQFTLREVARRAEVSHAAPYKHFPDKNSLLAELALIGFDQMGAELTKALKLAGITPTDRFFIAGKAYIQFGLTHPSLYKLMFSAEANTESSQVHLDKRAMSALGVLLEILETGQNQKEFKRRELNDQTAACWAQVHGLTMLSIDGLLFAEKVGENAIDGALKTLLEGLKA